MKLEKDSKSDRINVAFWVRDEERLDFNALCTSRGLEFHWDGNDLEQGYIRYCGYISLDTIAEEVDDNSQWNFKFEVSEN